MTISPKSDRKAIADDKGPDSSTRSAGASWEFPDLPDTIKKLHQGKSQIQKNFPDFFYRQAIEKSIYVIGRCPHPREELSPKEIEVIKLVYLGLPDKTIAQKLLISQGTLVTHFRRIRRKLPADSRIEIALWSIFL